MTALERLRAAVEVEGGILAGLLAPCSAVGSIFDEAAASVDRKTRTSSLYGFVLESILEGYLLHYRQPRVFGSVDSDMRLLGGDFLYALGLERLAESEDLAAMTSLTELLAVCSRCELEESRTSERNEMVASLWFERATSVLLGSRSVGERPGERSQASPLGDPGRSLAFDPPVRAWQACGLASEGRDLRAALVEALSVPDAEIGNG